MKTPGFSTMAMPFIVLATAAAAQDEYVNDRFAYKCSTSLAATVPEALEAFAAEAVEKVLPKATAPEDKQAYEKTLLEVRRRAQELVKYTVSDGPRERPGAQGYVELNARIRRADIEQIYAGYRKSAKSAPRYSIMVVMATDEHRRQRPEPIHVSHEIRPDSKIAAAIVTKLTEQGSKVINGNRFAEIQKFELDSGKLSNEDQKTLLRIAADKGADILVVGYAKADGPAPKVIEGRTFHEWHADATVEAFWADTGDVIGAIAVPPGRREAIHEVQNAGSERCMEYAGQGIAEEFARIMSERAVRVPEIKLTIYRVPEFSIADGIGKWLGRLPGVDGNRPDYQGEMLADLIKTSLTSQELARAIESWKDPNGKYRLKIKAKSTNAIEAELALNEKS